MQKEKQLMPKLRFPEFDGLLKKVELKNVATINPKNKELPVSFIYIDLESVNKGLLSKEVRIYKTEAPSRAQRLLKQGDILYQTVRPYQKNNYFFDKQATDYVASTGYTQIRTKNISNYLYQYLHTHCFVNKVLVRCTGTSYPTINSTDLSKINISIPSINEQQKIASFLTQVDTKITQLTKKKTLLEQYKKGVMQRIFKQELRFKDEGGKAFSDWEVKKIGKVFEERNEKNFTDMELLSVSINKGIYPQSESNKTDNSNSDKSKYKRVLKNDIAYNSMRMWQGASAVSKYDGIVSPAYTILEANDYNDSKYFGYLFKMLFMIQTFQKHSQGLTSDTWNLKYLMISKIKINVPSLKEQTKIGNFLSAIDKNIALVNTKIEHTKAYKKGLLQQMFV